MYFASAWPLRYPLDQRITDFIYQCTYCITHPPSVSLFFYAENSFFVGRVCCFCSPFEWQVYQTDPKPQVRASYILRLRHLHRGLILHLTTHLVPQRRILHLRHISLPCQNLLCLLHQSLGFILIPNHFFQIHIIPTSIVSEIIVLHAMENVIDLLV